MQRVIITSMDKQKQLELAFQIRDRAHCRFWGIILKLRGTLLDASNKPYIDQLLRLSAIEYKANGIISRLRTELY